MATPRPTKATEEMKREVARAICADLVEEGMYQQSEASDREAELAAVLMTRVDGYALARQLDDKYGWAICFSVIEVLEECRTMLDAAIIDAQRIWVKEEGIEPDLISGQSVVLRSGETGVIDQVSSYRPACYEVKIDGDADAEGPLRSRRLCRFEEVEVAPTPTL